MQLNLTLQVRWGVCVGGGGVGWSVCIRCASSYAATQPSIGRATQPAQEGGLLFHGLAEPVD
jgi:hypothetical protein